MLTFGRLQALQAGHAPRLAAPIVRRRARECGPEIMDELLESAGLGPPGLGRAHEIIQAQLANMCPLLGAPHRVAAHRR